MFCAYFQFFMSVQFLCRRSPTPLNVYSKVTFVCFHQPLQRIANTIVLAKNDQNWPKQQKLTKTAEIGQQLPKLEREKNGKIWPKIAQIEEKSPARRLLVFHGGVLYLHYR